MPTKSSFHHGDLRNALTDTAVALARAEGPDGVVLREIARRLGVTAAAAYRHFGSVEELLAEVKQRALAELAECLTADVERVPDLGDLGDRDDPSDPDAPGDRAVARLHAAARCYLAFARQQPGLFATAFRPIHEDCDQAAELGADAVFRTLAALLDDLVSAGRMDPALRPGAETSVWASVHGLALLLVTGPLRHTPAADQEWNERRTVDAIIAGLAGGRHGRRRD